MAKIRAAQGQPEIVGNLEGLFKLAQIDFAGAQATFADLMQKYPDFTPAKINLARVDIMLGDKASAEKILNDILTKQPTSEPALTMMVSSAVPGKQVAAGNRLTGTGPIRLNRTRRA